MEDNSKQQNNFLAASILVAAILISGALVYTTGLKNSKPQTANTKEAVGLQSEPQIGDDAVLGDPKAPVTVYVFSDYQCPYCAKFYTEAERQIRKNYVETGKAKMVYKDLSFLGPESIAASEAADCAKEQGQYWNFHDAIFDLEIQEAKTSGNSENTGNLTRGAFETIAKNLKMNIGDFLACFDSNKYASETDKDMEEAKALIPRISTPTIFINDKMVQGAYPYATFSQMIDAALNK